MDITAEDLTNKNLYDYCHAEDLQKIRKSHCDCEYCILSLFLINNFISCLV